MTKCRLFHDWDKWEDVTLYTRPNIAYPYGVEYGDPIYRIGQKKVCKRCGKKRIRNI